MAAPTRPDADPRRSMFIGAAVLFAAVALGAVAVALFAGDAGSETSTTTTAVVLAPDGSPVPVYERPSSLPQPNSGRAPQDSGDPGGWEQGLIFGLLGGGMLVIGFAIFRGGKRTRARRADWVAAAAPGQEDVRRTQLR